jgi:hypothetical protein
MSTTEASSGGVARGEPERRTGQPAADWARRYAAYMLAEPSGRELPR